LYGYEIHYDIFINLGCYTIFTRGFTWIIVTNTLGIKRWKRYEIDGNINRNKKINSVGIKPGSLLAKVKYSFVLTICLIIIKIEKSDIAQVI